MTKKNIFFLILAIMAAAVLLFLNHEWNIGKDILYLKNGNTIISDETWEGQKLVYYEAEGETRFLVKDKVEYIVSQLPPDPGRNGFQKRGREHSFLSDELFQQALLYCCYPNMSP